MFWITPVLLHGAIAVTGTADLDSTGNEYMLGNASLQGSQPLASNTVSQSFTVGANSNLLVVEISIRDTNGSPSYPASANPGMPATITFGSTTLTLAASQNSANGSWHNVGIYYAFLTPSSSPVTATISGVFGGSGTFWNYSLSAISLSGVNTAVAPVTSAADTQNTPVNSLSLSNLQNGEYAFVVASAGPPMGDVGQTFAASSGTASIATGALGANSMDNETNNNNFSSGYVAGVNAGTGTFTFTQDGGTSGSTGSKFCFAVAAFQPAQAVSGTSPNVPNVVGDFWQATSNPSQTAGNPSLGSFYNSSQQCVDFGVWQAADQTWQIWECIRGTNVPNDNRLFFNWQGAQITSTNWTPVGVALNAYPQNGSAVGASGEPIDQYGEDVGGLQAPEIFPDATGLYHMFYGSWNAICSATSPDGKHFTRVLNSSGQAPLFGLTENNPRDPMVIEIGNVWYCYYAVSSSTLNGPILGADYCRTSTDLVNWSAPTLVAEGGQAGTTFNSAECPFVVQLAPGQFYLFRTQSYGSTAKTSVYYSTNPLDFGVNNDSGHFIGTIPYCASEIVNYQGQYYYGTLLSNYNGIQFCHLTWPGAPFISSPLSITGTAGSDLTPYQIVLTNGATLSSVSGLPAGLSANLSTGVISGTASSSGTFPVTVTFSGSSGSSSETLSLTIASAPVSSGEPTMPTWGLVALALLLLGGGALMSPRSQES